MFDPSPDALTIPWLYLAAVTVRAASGRTWGVGQRWFGSGGLVAGQRERRRGEQHEGTGFGGDDPGGVTQVLVVDHDSEQRDHNTYRRRAEREQTGNNRWRSIGGLVGCRNARGGRDDENGQPGDQRESPQ